MDNSEQLGRQAWPGIEPGTYRLAVFCTEPLRHWWGQLYSESLSLESFEGPLTLPPPSTDRNFAYSLLPPPFVSTYSIFFNEELKLKVWLPKKEWLNFFLKKTSQSHVSDIAISWFHFSKIQFLCPKVKNIEILKNYFYENQFLSKKKKKKKRADSHAPQKLNVFRDKLGKKMRLNLHIALWKMKS